MDSGTACPTPTDVPTMAHLEALRVRLGVTQRDVCQRAGVHENTWSLHRRRRTDPRADVCWRLMDALRGIARDRGVMLLPGAKS
uniref:helix-turn-helix domain-containing protein n=1 Tax=Stappia sp. TaxID=1870903 RepID=UPI003BA8B25F